MVATITLSPYSRGLNVYSTVRIFSSESEWSGVNEVRSYLISVTVG